MKIDSSAISAFVKANGIQSINQYIEKMNNEENVKDSVFGNILKEAVDAANSADSQDKESNIKLLGGEINDLHSLMIAAEKADIALSLTIQIRNKVLDAYTEIMRMQI